MNPEAFDYAYELFVKDGYKKTKKEFYDLINSNPEALQVAYDLFVADGYQKGIEDFTQVVGVGQNAEVGLKKKDASELPPETGSLVSSEDNTLDFSQRLGFVPENEEESLLDARTLASKNITEQLIGMDETEAAKFLRDNFARYGFVFEESAPGINQLYVRTADGSKQMKLDLELENVRYTNGVKGEVKKLQDFISNNAKGAYNLAEEDFLAKAHRANNIRPIGRINDDGSESTVLMASAEVDGVNYAFPTLFPKEGNTKSMRPSDWVEYDISTDAGFDQAFNEAMKRGELFAFETEQGANEFAEGAWKNVNTIDYEADQFFKERGFNYRDIKKTREAYDRVSDELDILEGMENSYYSAVDAGVARQMAAKMGITGSVFEDTMITYEGEKVRYGDVVDRLKEEQAKYASVLFDVGGESPQDAIDQWDMYLEGELKKKSQRAIKQSQQTTANIEAIRRASLLTFGVQPEDLPTMQIPEDGQPAAQYLHDMYLMEKKDLEYAFDQFDVAKTYFDEKTNKQIQEVAVENLEGFAEMWKQGGGNGDALVQIMGVQMGVIDINDKPTRDEVIAKIIDAKERATGPTSLVVAGSMESRSLPEWFQYAGDNPLEWSTSLMAQSLSMMLPVGKFVAPAIIAPTVATYSAIPSLAGPEGTLAGAAAGLVQGTRLAFAATNFMVEYTNAFFDTMNERGLDAMNPQQLEAALMDDGVWEDTNTRGISRGIPISLVDFFGAKMAGRVLGTGLSTGGKAIAKLGAEQLIAGPGFEAIGETAAQITANITSGKSAFDINWAEVSAEAGGAFGNNIGNTAFNSFQMARNTVNNTLVDKMQLPSYINRLDVSDSKIQEWVKSMRNMRRITPEMEQRILENVGARREANKILTGSVNPAQQPKSAVRSRLMQLITARDKIGEMADSKAFRNVLSAIEEEIQFMAENGVMKAPNQRVDLTKKGITNILYSGQGRYRWGKDSLTKAEFLGKLNTATDEEVQREMDGPLGIVVANDPEVEQQVNDRINAIQEQSTDEVPVREQSEVGEEVDEEVRGAEEPTTEEEVTPAEEEAEVEVDEQELSDLEKLYGGERKDATGSDVKQARRGKKNEAVLATIADKLEASGGQINSLTRNERKVYEAQGDEVQAILEERKRLAKEAQEQEREQAIQAVIDAMLEEMRARMTQPEDAEEVEVEEREPITYGDVKNYEYKFADGSSEYIQVRELSDGRKEIVVGMRKNDRNQLRDIHTTMLMNPDYDFEANPEEVITMEEGAQLVITKPQTAEELELREFRDEATDDTDLTVDPDEDIDQELRFSVEEEEDGEVQIPTQLFANWDEKVMEKFFDTSQGYGAIKPFFVELAKRAYITPHAFQPDTWVFADPDRGSTELDVVLKLAPVRTTLGVSDSAAPNKIYIDLINVMGDQNKGAGTRAMNRLTEIADDLGFDIELQAWPPMREQVSKSGRELSERTIEKKAKRLVKFYEKFGFKLKDNQTKRGETEMERVASKTQDIKFSIDEERPKAGNRLFNEPLPEVSEIADRYYERTFGKPRPKFEGTREFDVARAKRIAQAFEEMEARPNDPDVRRAYEAMVEETLEQYKAFLDANFVIELNNEEGYNSSAEMIEDLRVNRRLKVFSTEAGFGSKGITREMRQNNPLLAKTTYTDAYGKPLLVNDIFRAVHDFFGHAELGNSFGPKGEENAWNVHVRMYSPLAAAAMTTETRGQNSYVNFSGVNDRVNEMRAEAARLREEGRNEEADAIVEKVYEEIDFADQKIGLLPEEYWVPDDVAPAVEPEAEQALGEEVVVSVNENPNVPSFKREVTFTTDGGRAVITLGRNSNVYSGFELIVEEGRRGQGIGTRLKKAMMEFTNNQFVSQVSSDASIAVNYKFGMRAYDEQTGRPLTLQETIDKRQGSSYESVFMVHEDVARRLGYDRPISERQDRKAPNGKKSNLPRELYFLVRTPEFKQWFGDWEKDPANASKVLDENGEPLVVYHGSPSVDITQFDEKGANQNRMSGLKEGGFYFTSNRNLAEFYAEGRAEAMDKEASDSRVYPMFLNIRDPFVHDGKSRNWPKWADDIIVEINPYYAKRGLEAVQYLLGQNSFASSPYDGVIVENANDLVRSSLYETIDDGYEGTLFIVPFDRVEAMKLADGSNYQFSPLTGDIRFMAQEIQPTSEEARESIKKDSTNLKVTGKEEVEAGANAPTIREVRKLKGKPEEVEFAENYSIDDLFNNNKGFLDEETGNFKLGSRALNFAMMLASGEFTYTKKVGEKSVPVVIKLPYENKEALSLLKRRINQYKKLGSSKEALKKKQEIADRIISLSKDIISDVHVTMTQNILAVYDTLTDDFVASSKEWYVGANRMANKLAKNYNISVEQAAGVIAALSPQNDWFNNVTVAERTLEIMANYADTRLTEEMYQKTRAYNQRGAKKGELSKYTKILDRLWEVYGGASLNEMEAMGAPVTHQADMLRALDQALLPNKVLATSPDGDFIGYDKVPIRWNSPVEIAKAINMARTNDPRVVAENLGGGSKVRNFYNNIVDPLSSTDYVTADTHALSVALGAPISANDAGGFKLFNPGFNLAYMLVKDAYIDAARIAGLDYAREMQSITWEAQRTGVNDASRTAAQKKANAELLSRLMQDQSLSPYERARIIVDANRSKPSGWATARGIETQRGVSELREGLQDQADQRVSDSVSVRRSASRDVGAAIAGLGRATKLTEEEKAQADIKAMARFGDPAGLSGLQASPEFIEEVNKRLKAIFPDVELFVTDEAWARLMEMPEVKKSIEGITGRLGGKVEFRGLAVGRGAVYVNPNVFRAGTKSFNVTIHEYGHIWFKALQTTEKGRALRKRGMGLAAKTELFQDVRRRFPDTPAGIFNAAEETLIIMVGNRGQDIINETLKQKFKNWLTEMWEFIRSRLKLSKDLSIEEIGNLNLSEFVDIAVGDILFGGFREEQSQKQENDASSRFLINFDIDEDGLYKVIREGRENGFSDASIRYYLRQQGFSAEQIDEAMAVPIDLERSMPQAFGDVPGGVNAGMRIYREVMAELDRFAHSGPRGGRRREVTKTFGEIRQKAHDILSSREDFQQFNDTLKKQMLIGLDKSIGIDENNKVTENVKRMKEMLRQRVFGQKELRQAQTEMRKFLRNNLPDDMRNKADIQRLMKLVQDTDLGNLRVVIDQALATLEKIAARDKKLSDKVAQLKAKLNDNRMSARELEQARLEARVFIRKNMPPSQYGKGRVDRFITMASNATPDTYNEDGTLTRNSISNVISRAIDEITKQRVSDLEAQVKKALTTGTSFLTVGRLKGKISPEAQDRIVSLKTLLASPGASIDTIMGSVESLRNRYNELASKGELTTEDAQEMMDLDIAINYNSALTMENTEQAKVVALETVLKGFSNILTEARNDFKELMRQQREYYNSLKSAFFTDVSGIAIDFNDPDSVAEARELLAALKVKELNQGLAVQAIKQLFRPFDQLITRTEALEGLLDRVSQMPGEMFGGVSRELILDRINESSREFKSGKMTVLTLLDAKAQEIYGKDYRKVMQRNGYKTEFYYVNPQKAAELEGKIQTETDPREVKKLTKQLEGLKMPISQNDMYYLYNQFKDEANHPGFETKFGKQYATIMAEITSKLDPKVKKWADWQVDEFYPSVYDRYNEVYRQIYRTNMPWNDKYAGRIIRERENMDTVDDFLNSTVYQTAVGSNSTKVRIRNSNAIKTRNGDSALNSYINEMEFFRAYAENMRDIIKMVRTPEVRTAIETVSGKDVYTILTTMLDRVMTRQMARETEASIVGFMSSGFVTANLGLNPTIYLKQATSALAFAGYIGYGNWFKYAALAGLESIKNWRTQWSELYANSPVLQDRYEFANIAKVLENYTDQDTTLTVRGKALVPKTTNEKIMNVMMFLVKQGDKLGVMGAIPNYVYYKNTFMEKNPSATEQQAIDFAVKKVEAEATSTQQDSGVQNKDYYQTGNELQRFFSLFLSSPKALFRKEAIAARNLYRKAAAFDRAAGKGTVGQNLRNLLTYHLVVPMLFQYVALGLPGLARPFGDEDKEDMTWAAVLGNLNAIFALGDIAVGIANAIQGKPWASDLRNLPILMVAGDIIDNLSQYNKAIEKAEAAKTPAGRDSNNAKAEKHLMKIVDQLANITGLPYANVRKMVENISQISDSKDPGEVILRLLNYGEYTIQRGKPEEKDRNGMSKSDMRIMFPDLYEDIYGKGTPAYERQRMKRELNEEKRQMKREAVN